MFINVEELNDVTDVEQETETHLPVDFTVILAVSAGVSATQQQQHTL